MPSKEFTSKQKEIVARKLGYDGPMHMFDEFLRSDPSMADRYGTVLDKYMARGGVVTKNKKKKYAAGGDTRLATEEELDRQALNNQTSMLINPGAQDTIKPAPTVTSAPTVTTVSPGDVGGATDQDQRQAAPAVVGPTVSGGQSTVSSGQSTVSSGQSTVSAGQDTVTAVKQPAATLPDSAKALINARFQAKGKTVTEADINRFIADATALGVDWTNPNVGTTPQYQSWATKVQNAATGYDPNDANADEITAIYRQLLGRDPDAGGLKFWDDSGDSATNIRNKILNSAEYANKKAAGSKVSTDTVTGAPTMGPVSGVTAATITQDPSQLIAAREGVKVSTAAVDTVSTTAQAESVKATAPESITASTTAKGVKDVTDTLAAATGDFSDTITAAEGTISGGGIATAAKFDVAFQDTIDVVDRSVSTDELVGAETQYTAPTAVVSEANAVKNIEAVTREVQTEELADAATLGVDNAAQGEAQKELGLTEDAKIVAAKLDKFTLDAGTLADFVEGKVEAKATVQGQLTELMKSFDDGKTPAWAAGAIRAANAAMASRGLGNSSMAATAIFQAAMESALPIAQQDANTFAQMGLQNLNNRQQVALANAAAQQGVEIANFNSEQQAALQNAANAFALQSQNLTNGQQAMLANLQIRAAVQQQELSNQQQAMLTNAARYAEIANINLNNQQQAALQTSAQNTQVDLANLSTRTQSALANAQIQAAMEGKVLDNKQQTAVINAAKYSEANNLTFTAKQNAMLHNSELMKTIGLANLNSEQAAVLQNAATTASMDMANLNNRQQAAVVNAQSFLQMDLANLSNEQQTALFKSQQIIQSLFTDAAAENAASQFNATSQMQTDQFFASLTAQVNQFNTQQKNAMAQFNSGQTNAIAQFNTQQVNAMEQFNAQQRLVIDQSNAEWRRNVATADTAAINQANQFNAQMGMQLSLAQYNNMWQGYRDTMQYSYQAGQNDLDRENRLAVATLQKEAAVEAAKAQRTAAAYQSMGALTATLLGKTTLGQTAVDVGKDLFKSLLKTSNPTLTDAQLNEAYDRYEEDMSVFDNVLGTESTLTDDEGFNLLPDED